MRPDLDDKVDLVESENSWTNASKHSNITSHPCDARSTYPNLFLCQLAHLCSFLEFAKNTCVENEKKHAPSHLITPFGRVFRRASLCSTCAAPNRSQFCREHGVLTISIPTFISSSNNCKQVRSTPLHPESFGSCCDPNRLVNHGH